MNGNLAIIESFVTDVWSLGRLERIPELVHEDYATEGRVVGSDWVRHNVSTFRAGFPDTRVTVLTSCAQGEMVAALVRMTGTHLADWGNLVATGKAVDFREACFWHVRDGRIVSGEFVAETLKARIQLGQIPESVWSGARLIPER